LYWEFYDSGSVLKFTATTISDPAITQDSDIDGDFMKVIDIPLSGWALGIATVQAFAKKDGQEIGPYPMLASVFQVVETLVGYCSVADVVNYSGVLARDLGQDSENLLQTLLTDWIAQA
ncbi:unnamed protein product, partial [marine sediment metagenome]